MNLTIYNTFYINRSLYPDIAGAVLSAKSQSDQQLSEARLKARKIIHAFHKAQDKMDELEVRIYVYISWLPHFSDVY